MSSHVSVFISTSPLHVLYSIAIVRELRLPSYQIHWFGKAPLSDLPYMADFTADENIEDFSQLRLNDFKGFLKDAARYVRQVGFKVSKLDYLFTCYDTHYAFEALRHHFRISWSQVGIIEDGLGNYFAHSMPPLRSRILKSITTRIIRGHYLNLSRHNLGGNPKVGFVSTLGPEFVYVASRSAATIIDIRSAVRELLDERGLTPSEEYREADVLLFLPAVLHYRRMTEGDLIRYIDMVRSHESLNGCARFVVKPHPREDVEQMRQILARRFRGEISLGDDVLIELFIKELDNPFWVGSPTTAMLNKHLLYPSGRTRFVLFPIQGNRHLETQIRTLRRILGDKVDHA